MEQEAIKTSEVDQSNSETSYEHISQDNLIISTDDQCSTPLSLQNHYEFIDEIGHGSQGKIYRAKRLSDNKIVVIKQLNINSIKNWKEYELFHREADILQTLNFKGVARFYDAIDCLDDDPPCSYIVQEFIPGISLQKMLDNGHRFKVDDVYSILIQTLSVLNKLHHHNPPVVHRDIKPSNLMITTDSKGKFLVTIIDFGAVANPQVQGGGSTVAGTYGYMPPEQLMGKPEPASDIYSVAALAVQLFCGKSPADLPVKDFRLIFEPEMQDKPHALVTTLRQMLEPKIEQRLQNIPQIIQDLTDYKNNRFEQKNLQNTSQYSKSFEEKLADVRSICQTGNMELWQQLPDLSRPIPQALQIENYAQNANDIVKFTGKTSRGKSNIFNIVFFISIIGLILLVIGGFLKILPPISGIFMVALTIIAFVSWLETSINIKFEPPSILSKNRRASSHDKQYLTKIKIFELIQNSRKDIATITKIEYIPVEAKDILINPLKETYYYLDTSTRNTLKKYAPESSTFSPHCMNAVLRRPRFRIQYRFNPPDDMRVADIYHTFITGTEPENHYQIGDPLPILYQIDDRYTEDVVTSMPFPVPLDDMDDESLIASSTTFENLNKVTVNRIKDKITRLFLVSRPGGLDSYSNQIMSLISSLNYHDKTINQITWLYILKCLQNKDYQKFHPFCITILFQMAFPPKPEEPVTEIQSFLLKYLRELNRDDELSRKIWLKYIYVISQNYDKLNSTDEYSTLTKELISTCFESLSPEYVSIIFNSLTSSPVRSGFIKLCSCYHLSIIDDNLHLLIAQLINSISATDKSSNQLIWPLIEKYLIKFTNQKDYLQHLKHLLRKIYPQNLPDIHEDIHTHLMDLIFQQIAQNGFDLSNPIIFQTLIHIKTCISNSNTIITNQDTQSQLLENLFKTVSNALSHSQNTYEIKILKSLNCADINHKLIALLIESYSPNLTSDQKIEFFKDLNNYLVFLDDPTGWKNDNYYARNVIQLIFNSYDQITANTDQDIIDFYLLEPLSHLYAAYSYKDRLPNLNNAPVSLIKHLTKSSSNKQIQWIEQTYKLKLSPPQIAPSF